MASPHTLHRLPLRVLDRIESAGGSAYGWYDKELTVWLDPTGRWSALSRLLTRVGLSALVVLWAVLAGLHTPWAAAVIVAVGVGGLARSRWTRLSWWVGAVAVLVADPAALTLIPGTVLLVGVLALATLGQTRRRGPAMALTATVVAVGHIGAPDDLRALVVNAVGVLGGLGLLWWTSGRSLPLPIGRVNASHLEAHPPPPPSTVPWLLPHLPGNAEKIASPPPDLSRKKAGGYGERRTGLLLLGLRRGRGTRIGHDVDLPGADNANVDHFVLTQAGVFVLDSKQFGTRSDPGTVVRRGPDIVHLSDRGARSLTSSLKTAAWATSAVAEILRVPARGVLVVHNASVAAGLTFLREDGVAVDVVAADRLVDRIDGAPRTLSRSALTNATWRCSRLRSSVTRLAPVLSSPLGVRGRPRPAPWETDVLSEQEAHEQARQQRLADAAGGSPPTRPPTGDADVPPSSAPPQGWSDAPSAPHPPQPPPWLASSGTEDPFADDPFAEPPPETGAPTTENPFADDPFDVPATQGVGDPARPGPGPESQPEPQPVVFTLGPEAMAELDRIPDANRETVLGNWAQMEMSEHADPDEVEHDLRALARGDRVEVVEFADGDLRASEMVAMSPPCRGVTGAYVWVCLPSNWTRHQQNGQPVFVGTVSADKVIRLGTPNV